MADIAFVSDDFDDAERRRAMNERGPAPDAADEPVLVDVDTLIDRSDELGEGAATLIAAGDPIPPNLIDLPRKPRERTEPAKATGKAKTTTVKP